MVSGGKPAAMLLRCLHSVLEEAETILDIGTSQRFAKELRPHEHLFEGKQYVAAGFNPAQSYGAYNCDCHQDIERMTFPDESFDAVICLEVLEHVQAPSKAVTEIHRVLRPKGKALVSAPFLTSYHGKGSTSQAHESYPDYWRFTHEGLLYLFRDFRECSVYTVDGPMEMRLSFLVPGRLLRFPPIRRLMDVIDRPTVGRAATRHFLLGLK